MKKIIISVAALLMLLFAAGCSGAGKADFTDVNSGAKSITKAQADRIESLGKCVNGQKIVVTADVSEFEAAFNGFEYMVFTINSDTDTNAVLTWRFCEDEQAYTKSLAELKASGTLQISEHKDELTICYGTGQPRDGGYDTVRSGLENDTLRDYIFVE